MSKCVPTRLFAFEREREREGNTCLWKVTALQSHPSARDFLSDLASVQVTYPRGEGKHQEANGEL